MNNVNDIFKEAPIKRASFFYHKIYLVGLIALFLSSCISFKPNAKKSPKSLYTTFFVGESGTQYFIKPLLLKNVEKESILIDFTFRDKVSLDSNMATVNASLLLNHNIKNVDSLLFRNNNYSITFNEIKVFFKEKKDDQILIRINSENLLANICKIFEDPNWHVEVYGNSSKVQFESFKKTNKSITLLKSNVFDLLTL